MRRLRVPDLRWLWMLPICLVWTWPRRGAQAARRGALWVLLVVLHWFVAQALFLRASPRQFYLSAGRKRDWTLAKVSSLQEESAKWKTAFSLLRSPYSFLLKMGLSPSAAGTLLFAGTAVGGGVVVTRLSLPRGRSAGEIRGRTPHLLTYRPHSLRVITPC